MFASEPLAVGLHQYGLSRYEKADFVLWSNFCLLIIGVSGFAADPDAGPKISWSKNMLTLKGDDIPSGSISKWRP